MTKQEAQKIVDDLKGWNTDQTSIDFAFHGIRTPADDMYDAKREALRKAWRVLGEADEVKP